ncbi:hypothetical protein [Mesorhizobium sp. M0843]|uniref:hypothetical protein n=1 Tax=Mesorhizobium sp. M0843 TaxID=2957010 RepID=UPI00333907C0
MIVQEQFDRIYLGLAAQGWQRSFDSTEDLCMYRGPDQRKCAIGHLIDDDDYRHDMDDVDAGVFSLVNFQQRDLLTDLTSDEFQDLQAAHDNNDLPGDMRVAFEDLAGRYGLTVPVSP